MTRAQKVKLRCRFSMTFNPTLKIVALEDKDDGSMTVTNDAENVIAWLFEQLLLRDGEHVIYRDTIGRWDELLHKDGKFVGFKMLHGCLNMAQAAMTAAGVSAYEHPAHQG